MNHKRDKLYMDLALRYAKESYCVRKQVGSVVVTVDEVTLGGYNGTGSGLDNVCELDDGTTNPETIHGEVNSLLKALRAGVSTKGADLFCTLAPCIECSKLIAECGIKRVVYKDTYKCDKGISYLLKRGVVVDKFTEVTDERS